MHIGRTRNVWLAACFTLVAGCAADSLGDDPATTAGGGGKADGPGSVPGEALGTWSREVIDNDSTLWNGGPTGWGAGTTIAMRADGQPIIAYYDASHHCNNGGFGTYSADALMVARVTETGWQRRVEACGPEAGYWPRLRVDASDRTHVLFGAGWYTGTQRAFYVRWDAAGTREVSKLVDGGYMSPGPFALMLDDTDAPVVVSDGKLIAEDGTKVPLFVDSSMQTFAERDAAGAVHVVANTMIQDPTNPSSSTGRMRYARHDANGVTIEIPRTVPVSTPLGLVIDSAGEPHILSWNAVPMGSGELWHTTRTSTGWVDELIASDITRGAAMAIGADDELVVVASGRVFRHAAGATEWTTSIVSQLGSANNLSLAIAEDGALHVAFQLVGSIMSNRVSRAPVYHATFQPVD
jgi:hypothetical protein